MTPVDIYVRTSAEGDREHIRTLDEQVKDARAYAESHSLELSGTVHEDKFRSGADARRPGLKAALERVESGASGGIIVAYLSRLVRETSAGLGLLDRVRAAGGQVYAPNLPSDHGTADGRLVTTVQLAIDAHYREKVGELTTAAVNSAIREGVPTSATAAVGYIDEGKGRKRRRRINPETAPAVLHAFRMRARGAGPTEIARYLDDQGVRTSRGNHWGVAAVHSMLRNRTYLGESCLRDGTRVPLTHDPIVDELTFERAQRVGAQGSPKKRPEGRKRFNLLSGVARCGGCLYSLTATRDSSGAPIYRCSRRHAAGVCPNPTRILAEQLEDAVVEAYLSQNDVVLRREAEKPAARLRQTLQAAYVGAQRRYEQVMRDDARDALGDEWAADAKAKREARDAAQKELDLFEAAAADVSDEAELLSLRSLWLGELDDPKTARVLDKAAKARLLRARYPVVLVHRMGRGTVNQRIELDPHVEPADLPKPGVWRPKRQAS